MVSPFLFLLHLSMFLPFQSLRGYRFAGEWQYGNGIPRNPSQKSYPIGYVSIGQRSYLYRPDREDDNLYKNS